MTASISSAPSKIGAIVLVMLSAFFFTAMIIVPRLAPLGTSPFIVSWIRFFSAAGVLVPVYLWRRGRFVRPSLPVWIYAARAVLAIAVLITTVFAITHAPVVIVQAILMANGAFTLILASLIAHERPAKVDLIALVLIIGGGVFSVFDAPAGGGGLSISSDELWGVGTALLAAMAWGGEVLMTRKLAQHDHALRLVTLVSLLGLILISPIAAFVPDAGAASASGFSLNFGLGWVGFAILCLMGLFAALGQICSATALARISASEATPYRYSSVVFALILGYAVFGEIPTAHEWIGAAIILCGIVMSGYGGMRERARMQRA
jgi:drug/metabolite transporter (DMT)-like permease